MRRGVARGASVSACSVAWLRAAAGRAPFFLMRKPLAFFFEMRPSAGASVALTCGGAGASAGGSVVASVCRVRACAAFVAACVALRASSRAFRLASLRSRFSSCFALRSTSPATAQHTMRALAHRTAANARIVATLAQTRVHRRIPRCKIAAGASRKARSAGGRSGCGCVGTYAAGRSRAGLSAATGCSCATSWRARKALRPRAA